MGGTVSRGIDNQSLIDELINSGTKLTPELERAMRLVDRGDYAQERNQRVYMDLAWRSKTLHLSAPSIYAVALENLDIEPGLRFLNVGSGTGYLSTIIGLILGENGVNHGLEVEKLNVMYARERLATFLRECDAPFERSFCAPYFMQGNILDLVAPPLQSNSVSAFANGPARNAPSTQEDTSVGILITLINPSLPSSQGSTLSTFFPPRLHSNRSGNSPIAEDADESLDNEAVEEEEEPFSTAADANHNMEISEESAANVMDENDDDDVNDDEDDDDDDNEEEGYESNNRRYDSILRDGHCPIAPPPVLSNNPELLCNDTDKSLSRWPLYDRIYVGAAVVDRSHLEAILRLLEVGGIMIAPVRDKFLKIKRTSENSISITELMAVSFATLVIPSTDSSHLVEMPPPRQVASLEQTCARFIRARLKKVIESRHNGLPTLGRLEEIKTDVDEQESVDSDTRPSCPINNNNGGSENNNKNSKNNNIGKSEPSGSSDSPSAKSTSTGVNSCSSYVDSTASSGTTENRPTTDGQTTLLDWCNLGRQRLAAARSTDNPDTDDFTNSNDDSASRGTSPKRQKSQYRWVSQSYTYKEEMKKILLEELHFTAFLARSVITL